MFVCGNSIARSISILGCEKDLIFKERSRENEIFVLSSGDERDMCDSGKPNLEGIIDVQLAIRWRDGDLAVHVE